MNFLKIHFSSILFIFFVGCKDNVKFKTEEEPILFLKEATLVLIKSSGEFITKLDIEIANSPYERQTGLMYRTILEKNQGMLFIFDKESFLTFYMKNTYIPLDLIFINDNKEIVSIYKNSKPNNTSSISSKLPSKYVLEVNEGFCENYNLKIGDKINYKFD